MARPLNASHLESVTRFRKTTIYTYTQCIMMKKQLTMDNIDIHPLFKRIITLINTKLISVPKNLQLNITVNYTTQK